MTTMEMYEAIRNNDKATEYANRLLTEQGYTFEQATTETYMLYAYSSKEVRK